MLSTIVLRFLYFTLLIPLTLYGLGTCYLLYVYLRHANRKHENQHLPDLPDEAHLPQVTVQIPLYNERYVACRVIEHAAAIDYPREKLHIQILDDSTDDTTTLIQSCVEKLQGDGYRVEVLHRTDRVGYKGGALANGMEHTDSEFIVVFDADFIPPPGFLRETLPYFLKDEKVGLVQTRWSHLNADDNLLTRCQALMLDCHFAVEQYARHRGGLIMTFNGTGGIWRRKAIEEAGGWSIDTLAEDQDLSYRAQIKGWKFVFLRDLDIPGELPPQMNGFRQQQERWAKGTTQVLMKIWAPLLRSKLTRRQRVMGFLHLSNYVVQTLSLMLLLLMPFLLISRVFDGLPLSPLGFLTLSIPILHTLGQAALYPNWIRRSLFFPLLLALSSGLTVSNASAVMSAFLGRPNEFKRTPKYSLEKRRSRQGNWLATSYAAFIDRKVMWELAAGLYALWGMTLAANLSPSLVLYFAIYTIGFFAVAGWSVVEYWLALRAAQQSSAT